MHVRRMSAVRRAISFACILLACIGVGGSGGAGASTATLNPFYPSTTYGAGMGETAITTYDFDGDGRKDVVAVLGCCTGNTLPTALIFLQGPNGLLESPLVKTLDTSSSPSGYAWTTPEMVVAGDFNGDGYPDLAILSADGVIHISPGTSSGDFGTPIAVPFITANYTNYRYIQAVDWFRNGKTELVTIGNADQNLPTQATHLQVLQVNTDGTLTVLRDSILAFGTDPGNADVVDFEGTGANDVVLCCTGAGPIAIQRDNGTSYDAPESYGEGANNSFEDYFGGELTLADLNGDGRLDIVAGGFGTPYGDGLINIYTQNVDKTFSQTATPGTYNNPTGVAVADFLGTGLPGIVVSDNGWGAMSFVAQSNPGVFFNNLVYPVPVVYGLGATSYGPGALVADDISSDGKADVILADASEGLVVWYNTAGAVPTVDAGLDVSAAPALPVIGDDVTFTATVSNSGTSTLDPAQLQFTIPYLFSITSLDPSCVYIAPNPAPPRGFKQLITCTTAPIGAGQQQTFTIRTTAITDPYPTIAESPDYKHLSFGTVTTTDVDTDPVNNFFMFEVIPGSSHAAAVDERDLLDEQVNRTGAAIADSQVAKAVRTGAHTISAYQSTGGEKSGSGSNAALQQSGGGSTDLLELFVIFLLLQYQRRMRVPASIA